MYIQLLLAEKLDQFLFLPFFLQNGACLVEEGIILSLKLKAQLFFSLIISVYLVDINYSPFPACMRIVVCIQEVSI